MSTVKFVPKPFKVHIKIHKDFEGCFFLWPLLGGTSLRPSNYVLACQYCEKVNEGEFSTPGEAARALFNYKGDLCK